MLDKISNMIANYKCKHYFNRIHIKFKALIIIHLKMNEQNNKF